MRMNMPSSSSSPSPIGQSALIRVYKPCLVRRARLSNMQWNAAVVAAVKATLPSWSDDSELLLRHFAEHGAGTIGEYPLPRCHGSSTLCAAYAAQLCSANSSARVLIVTCSQAAALRMLQLVDAIGIARDRIRVTTSEGYRARRRETMLVDNYAFVENWPALRAFALGFGAPSDNTADVWRVPTPARKIQPKDAICGN